jgi:NhaP-type Na+/H+ or K+/H+ antiporter
MMVAGCGSGVILAFLVVGASCALMVPIMLYMFDLKKYGWTWIHACMFGAIVASTDAVAIVSIMKTSECCRNGVDGA